VLHLRILVPPELTPSVRTLLDREAGAVHLSIVPGAAVDPVGDLIEVDVEQASLAAITSRLDDLGVARRGSYSFSDVMDARSVSAEAARRHARSVGADVISWDEVAARTRDDAQVTLAFLVLMVLAGVIAAAGILTDNELLIVGAMIVSPDYGPLAGLCVAIVTDRRDRIGPSSVALVVGFFVASVAAAIVALAASWLGLVPVSYVAGDRPVTALIAEPNWTSFLVSLAAGVAGMVALGQAKSGAVVGVLVSVTTIPAAANVGVALALGNLDEATGALAQLLINLGGMIVAGVATLLVGRRLSRARAIAELRSRRRERSPVPPGADDDRPGRSGSVQTD
jgi:uncharacterized hydrophobic protein (TIGR00271 family)